MRLLANCVTRFYRFIFIFWIILMIGMAIFAIRLPLILEGDGFQMDGEHTEVMDIVSESFDVPVESMLLVFDEVGDETIQTTIEAIEELEITTSIDSPLENERLYKEELSYALLHFDDRFSDRTEAVTDIRASIDGEKGITLTGESAITKDINSASQRDLLMAEAIGLPIAIIILLLAFGTVVASLIPLFVGISAVIVSFGLLTLIGGSVDLSIFILNITPMLGLALSIDFSLLFISRYREERERRDILDAVSVTIQTAGRSVLFSAFCVFIGLGAMSLIKVDIFGNIALGGMIVVLLAVISSVTLLPATLILLGDRIDKWRVLRVKDSGSDRWRKFANGVIKRPVLITVVALVVLAIALLPVRHMELTIPQIDSLPETYDSRVAYEQVEDAFGLGETSTLYAVATRDDGWEHEDGWEQIERLEAAFMDASVMKEATTIYGVTGLIDAEEWSSAWDSPMQEQIIDVWESFVQGDELFIPLELNVPGNTGEAQEWIRTFSTAESDIELLIGGDARFNQEIFDEIADKVIPVVLIIMVTTFIVLMIAFQSILIPIKAILMNVVGLGATFGILVYIFQFGHFGMPEASIALILPVIVFSLVFGLSMDYEVFLISRMQEEYAKTLDNDYATVEGLAKTSKVITSAALIMIVLTGAFAFTDVMPVKQIGVGIAIAVAIDASIIRLLLVPSLMKMFGKWNWWMPFRKGQYTAGKIKDER